MFYDDILERFCIQNKVEARVVRFENPTRSVDEAAKTADVSKDDLVKTVVFFDEAVGCVACVVLGTDKVDTKKLKKLLKVKNLEFANPLEVLKMTGYPAGGVPPIGFPAKWFVDEKVLKKRYVLGGGGADTALLKIVPKELLRLNKPKVISITS